MKRIEIRRKCLSLIIAMLMVFTCMPSMAFAGTEADVAAPTVLADTLKVDATEPVTVGDTVKVFVKIEDESAINRVVFFYYYPNGEKTKQLVAEYDESIGYYVGEFIIDEGYESGIWKIFCIRADDEHGNSDYIYNSETSSYGTRIDLSTGNFEVYGTEADLEAPNILTDTLKVNVTEKVTIGDAVKVSVKVTDNNEIEDVSISYYYPNGEKTKQLVAEYDESTGYYTGEFTIDDNCESGMWKIWAISTRDEYGNSGYIYNSETVSHGVVDLSAGNFEVYGTEADMEAPTVLIDTLKVDATESVTMGDTVKVSVKVEDDNIIKEVRIVYYYPSMKKTENVVAEYDVGTGCYVAEFKVDESYESGIWKLFWISTEDEHGNRAYIYNEETNSYGTRVDLSAGDFVVKRDKVAPTYEIDSLTASNNEITVGESTNISLSATDEYGISSVKIFYEKPISKEEIAFNLTANGDDSYTATFNVGDYEAFGVWKVKRIDIEDINENAITIFSNAFYIDENAIDLSAGNFTVEGTELDSIAPTVDLNSVTINKKRINAGTDYVASVDVNDSQSGVASVKINYIEPDSGDIYSLDLTNSTANTYTGTINAGYLSTHLGKWTVESIEACDNVGNKIVIDDGLGALSFESVDMYIGVPTVSGVTVYDTNATISNQTIYGDVYIGPNAVVTLSDTTVYGNIYVLGGLRFRNSTVRGVYGRSFSAGYGTTFYNGTVYWAGSCSFDSMIATTYPIESIPYSLYNDVAKSINGVLLLQGSTINVAPLYVNGHPVAINEEGKFYVDDLDIGDSETITLKWVTVFGNAITRTVKVDKYVESADGVIHHKPVLNTVDATLKINSEYNLLDYVVATDEEDGEITENVIIDASDFDIATRGKYEVKYTITDSNGATTSAVAIITVVDPKVTGIKLAENVSDVKCNIEGMKLTAEVATQDDLEYEVIWSSSNDSVATVNQSGYVTIKSAGEVTITAEAGGVSASCTLSINHSWDKDYTIDQKATCTEKGLKSIHCSICGISNDSTIEEIDMVEHDFSIWLVDEQPTCIEDGFIDWQCSVCGEYSTETLLALGHSWNDDYTVDKEATCIEEGSKSIHCLKCEATKDVVSIDKVEHSYGEWIIDKEASCTEAGSKHKECACGDVVTEDIEAVGHCWDKDYTVDKEATCTEEGSKSIHCSKCEATKDVVSIDKIEHSYGEWIIDKEASCTEAGSKHKECACGDVVTEDIEAAGHSWDKDYTVDEEATCTEEGSKSIHCSKCDEIKNREIVEVLGHTEVIDAKVAAKVGKSGKTEGKHCSVCNEILAAQKNIPAVAKPSTVSKTYNGKYQSVKIKIKDTKGKTITTVTLPKGKSVGVYSKSVKLTGNYSGTIKVSYKINPKSTYITKLTKGKKYFTVKWKKQSGKMATSRITGYQYRYSTSSKMTNAKTITVKGYSKTSAKKTKLKAKKKYYVQVRTYKIVKGVKYYSSWSKAKSVKTK